MQGQTQRHASTNRLRQSPTIAPRYTRLSNSAAARSRSPEGRARLLLEHDQRQTPRDFTNKRGYKNRALTEADKQTNRRKSAVRSEVEHPFLTIKRLWGFGTVRYHGFPGQECQSGVRDAGVSSTL